MISQYVSKRRWYFALDIDTKRTAHQYDLSEFFITQAVNFVENLLVSVAHDLTLKENVE